MEIKDTHRSKFIPKIKIAYKDFNCEHCVKLIKKGEQFVFDKTNRKTCLNCNEDEVS